MGIPKYVYTEIGWVWDRYNMGIPIELGIYPTATHTHLFTV